MAKTGTRASAPKAPKRNALSRVGDETSRVARREMLLLAMKATEWSLTAAAALLEMSSPSDVRRALLDLAPEEFAAAQREGLVSRANRT
jgi:hypothetical protein